MTIETNSTIGEALYLLEKHYESFSSIVNIARETQHPVPTDTRGWSQILVSVLTKIPGLGRKKGADFADGSDVKGANTWEAIDTPRFNGVIKAGTKAEYSGSIESLDTMPHLFFVLWDTSPRKSKRCRIWCVRAKDDSKFRTVCKAWYNAVNAGTIKSTNFQLHPPIGTDTNEIRNNAGNLHYPLFFCAERENEKYVVKTYSPDVLTSGKCSDNPTGVMDQKIRSWYR